MQSGLFSLAASFIWKWHKSNNSKTKQYRCKTNTVSWNVLKCSTEFMGTTESPTQFYSEHQNETSTYSQPKTKKSCWPVSHVCENLLLVLCCVLHRCHYSDPWLFESVLDKGNGSDESKQRSLNGTPRRLFLFYTSSSNLNIQMHNDVIIWSQ